MHYSSSHKYNTTIHSTIWQNTSKLLVSYQVHRYHHTYNRVL